MTRPLRRHDRRVRLHGRHVSRHAARGARRSRARRAPTTRGSRHRVRVGELVASPGGARGGRHRVPPPQGARADDRAPPRAVSGGRSARSGEAIPGRARTRVSGPLPQGDPRPCRSRADRRRDADRRARLRCSASSATPRRATARSSPSGCATEYRATGDSPALIKPRRGLGSRRRSGGRRRPCAGRARSVASGSAARMKSISLVHAWP